MSNINPHTHSCLFELAYKLQRDQYPLILFQLQHMPLTSARYLLYTVRLAINHIVALDKSSSSTSEKRHLAKPPNANDVALVPVSDHVIYCGHLRKEMCGSRHLVNPVESVKKDVRGMVGGCLAAEEEGLFAPTIDNIVQMFVYYLHAYA